MFLKDILSKPVINVTNGMLEGIVTNAVFDSGLRSVDKLVVFGAVAGYIRSSDIKLVTADSLVTEVGAAATDEVFPVIVADAEVFTRGGKRMGKVVDIELKEFEVVRLFLDTGRVITPGDIFVRGDIIILKEGSNKSNGGKKMIEEKNKTPDAGLQKSPAKPRAAKPKSNGKIETAPKAEIPLILPLNIESYLESAAQQHKTPETPAQNNLTTEAIEQELTLELENAELLVEKVPVSENTEIFDITAVSLPEETFTQAEGEAATDAETVAIEEEPESVEDEVLPEPVGISRSVYSEEEKQHSKKRANQKVKITPIGEGKKTKQEESGIAVEEAVSAENTLGIIIPDDFTAFMPATNMPVDDEPLKVMRIDINTEPLRRKQHEEEDTAHIPDRILADFTFLLGRITSEPIKDSAGRVIIHQNELVTSDIVLLASKRGVLIQLTKYSLS